MGMIVGIVLFLVVLFFLIDMYRFIRKTANCAIEETEYLRQLTAIAKKYYRRDFAESIGSDEKADDKKD